MAYDQPWKAKPSLYYMSRATTYRPQTHTPHTLTDAQTRAIFRLLQSLRTYKNTQHTHTHSLTHSLSLSHTHTHTHTPAIYSYHATTGEWPSFDDKESTAKVLTHARKHKEREREREERREREVRREREMTERTPQTHPIPHAPADPANTLAPRTPVCARASPVSLSLYVCVMCVCARARACTHT
jgi:hypothetical protein